MRYTNDEIRANIVEFISETKQDDLVSVISYCLGYYGYITKQIWNEIRYLKRMDVIHL